MRQKKKKEDITMRGKWVLHHDKFMRGQWGLERACVDTCESARFPPGAHESLMTGLQLHGARGLQAAR